jgi:hypothetical protein
MYRKLGALVLCMTVSACSSSGSSDGNNGGASGTATNGGGSGGASTGGTASVAGSHAGGTSGAGTSAGGGANGSTVRGAVSLNIQAAAGCELSAQTLDFPVVTSGHPVTATDQSGDIADQQVDSASGYAANVHCIWFNQNSPYKIDAGVTLGRLGERLVALGPTFAAGSTNSGTLVMSTPDLPDPAYQGDCTYSVIKVDPVTRSVWGSFTCASLDASSSPTGCTVGTSYFSFENCTTP